MVLVFDIVLLCFMTHRLIVLYICMRVHSNRFNSFQLTAQRHNNIANAQREITPKRNKAELWFSSMAHCLIVLYNCMKIHSNSFNRFQITART